jgi:hypothetical protein
VNWLDFIDVSGGEPRITKKISWSARVVGKHLGTFWVKEKALLFQVLSGENF